jgi:hypothetical protein
MLSCFRNLQIKLDQPVSAPASPRNLNNGENAPANSTPEQLTSHIDWLRNEVARLKHQLTMSQQERNFVLHNFNGHSETRTTIIDVVEFSTLESYG